MPFPPNKGDKVRTFNLIKEFSKKHSIHLVTFVDVAEDAQYAPKLQDYCKSVKQVRRYPKLAALKSLPYLLSPEPVTIPYFYHKKMQSIVSESLENNSFDIIFVFSSCMAQYIPVSNATPKVIDLVDADSEKWIECANFSSFPKSIVYKNEGRQLRKYEEKLSGFFDLATVVSRTEKVKLEKFIKKPGWIQVVQNGINHKFYTEEHIDTGGEFLEGDFSHSILFVGGMFYFAYIDGILNFYNESFQKIKKAFPKIRFFVVGADPAPSIRSINRDQNVCVTGFVKDVRPFLKKASVYVAPLRMAPGLQNKILEAMVTGLAVVSTSEAISGIDARDGIEVIIEDEPGRFGERVVELLGDEGLRKKIGENAKKMVLEKYNWEKNLEVYNDFFHALCKRKKAK